MNPKLGDVGFKVGGKNYVLNMGVNALCLVEHVSGQPATKIVERMLTDSMVGDMRLLFWSGLQRHHPDVSIEAAGDLIQAVNKTERRSIELILESMALCSPDAEDAKDSADPQLPATDGTGTASS